MAQLKDYSIPELIHLLGSRYRDYRQRADMTQKEVAERAGLSVVTVYKFESGAANNLSRSRAGRPTICLSGRFSCC